MAAPTLRVTSSRSLSKLLSAAALAVLLGGCSHVAEAPGAASIAYVQMDELVKKHPLYAQLSHVDEGIAAVSLRADIAGPQLTPEQIARDEKALQKQLNDAAGRTQALIKQKQIEYAKRENEAMRRLLESAGAMQGASAGGTIDSAMAATQAQQSNAALAARRSGVEQMRNEALKSGQAALDAAHKTLGDRANAQYHAKVEELAQRESTSSLRASREHAAERLSLRTKLSNLALDDAARLAARARLDELDREESDALAALRNRDSAELLAYRTQLDKQLRSDLSVRTQEIQKRTLAQLNLPLAGGPAPPGPAGAQGIRVGPAGVSASLRSQLDALHKKYQADFDKDTHQVVADFEKTRQDLGERFARLHGVDAAAGSSTQRELEALKKQRSDLYGQIVAEIDSEVRVIAQRRGINVVVGNTVAPGGGVDLTPDAAKVVETLHE